jgi:hypothetical protein
MMEISSWSICEDEESGMIRQVVQVLSKRLRKIIYSSEVEERHNASSFADEGEAKTIMNWRIIAGVRSEPD